MQLVHLHRLPFQLLVILEEPPQHRQPVRRQLLRLAEAVVLRVVHRHRQHLVVLLAAVDHRHQADGTGLHQGQRGHRLLAQHQDVQRIVVFRQGLRDEAVVGRIVDRRVEDAVQLEQPRFLVQLVLDARPHRDLDDRRELGGQMLSGSHVVPGVGHGFARFALEDTRGAAGWGRASHCTPREERREYADRGRK